MEKIRTKMEKTIEIVHSRIWENPVNLINPRNPRLQVLIKG